MDRFIDLKNNYLIINGKFKIQYGQIYSYNYKYYKNAICNLKSNMDRFIELQSWRKKSAKYI